jgi:hypothetical protein
MVDFAENYSFLAQDAAEDFCWHNIQVTLGRSKAVLKLN